MTFNSRVVITKDKLETWLSTATRQRHLSEDPVSRLLRLSRETPLISRSTRHRFQKDWYNTPYSCHIWGDTTTDLLHGRNIIGLLVSDYACFHRNSSADSPYSACLLLFL